MKDEEILIFIIVILLGYCVCKYMGNGFSVGCDVQRHRREYYCDKKYSF